MAIPAPFDTLKEKLTAHGFLDENGLLTEAGKAYFAGYEARHPKLKLEDLGPIVREFQDLGIEAWEDRDRCWVRLRLQGKKVDAIRYVSRVISPGFSQELVEDMRAELAQRDVGVLL